MRLSFVVILLTTIFVVYTGAVFDTMWGTISPNDTVISKTRFVKFRKPMRTLTHTAIIKPKEGSPALTISGIYINNKLRNKGATATLLSGGPGHKTATILFISQKGHGIRHEIAVYGH